MKNQLPAALPTGLLRAYGAILFAEKPWIGGLFLLATFWFPNAGLSGLLAAVVAMVTARMLRFPHLESGLHVYNSLLVGLSLGAYYQLDLYLGVLIVLGAIMAVFATVALVDMLWRLDHLPVLSLPFVLVAMTTSLAAHSYGTLSRYLEPVMPHGVVFHPWLDQFFTALGSSFFTPHPVPGLLMFIGMLLTSRYIALLAVCGFALGFSTYALLAGSPHPALASWNGFNFILTAIALGAIFTVPDKQSFALAMIGSVLAALVTAATENLMLVYGLPVMTLPFLTTTLILLLALRKREAAPSMQLLLERPGLPEQSFERVRLAEARHGSYGSVPLSLPFYGRWTVYQGFNGPHTHRPPWQYALDFYITDQGKSFHGDGGCLADYYCFGLPLTAPAAGYVVAIENSLPDNPPGHVDTFYNWGNHVVLALNNGLFVLLAHLKQYSVEVQIGTYVTLGQTLAACGSSGRSPQPHIHVHVQTTAALGSSTVPFHLAAVLHTPATSHERYCLHITPDTEDQVILPHLDTRLHNSIDLRVGRTFVYRVDERLGASNVTLTVVLSLNGEFRLQSDSGASVAFVYHGDVLAFYDRQGMRDALLDALVLGLGVTPFYEGVAQWQDAPPLRLLPMSPLRRLAAAAYYPLGEGLNSHYQRQWHHDHWQQRGSHRLTMPWQDDWQAQTTVSIVANVGCTKIELQGDDGFHLTAALEQYGQQADGGIPAWTVVAKATRNK
ncbi:MAG: urea transporter [Mariprofundaceae bacterium]|nr:urea transporter [Mariprofundaceae bacterium]